VTYKMKPGRCNFLLTISFSQALTLKEFERYDNWQTTTMMLKIGYSYEHWSWALMFLYISAFVLRVAAFPFFRKKTLC